MYSHLEAPIAALAAHPGAALAAVFAAPAAVLERDLRAQLWTVASHSASAGQVLLAWPR